MRDSSLSRWSEVSFSAIGLIGTPWAASVERPVGGDLFYDCYVETPEPDCPQRIAAVAMWRTVTLAFEILLAVGFLTVVVAAVLDFIRKDKTRSTRR